MAIKLYHKPGTVILEDDRGELHTVTNIEVGLAADEKKQPEPPKKLWPNVVKPNRHERRKSKALRK